jgi:uncharacterized tellurite resistance protein B-like protein
MKRLDHLKNLVVMAVADGSVHEHELAYLSERCAALGLDQDQLAEAVSFALSGKAAIQLPTDPDEQEKMLCDLIRMMAVDGQLNKIEKQLFAVAAAKMGCDRENLNQLIDRLLEENDKDDSPRDG